MSPPSPPRPLVVLGIDPGTLVVGYGAVVDGSRGPRLYAAGVLRAPARASVPARLAHLRREIDELLGRLSPAIVVVEQAFAAKNVRSALRIGEGRGVALSAAAASGAEVVEMPPAVAKKALVGNGAADKRQVARMVATALGVADLDLPLDASDALALALAQVQRRRFPVRVATRRGLVAALGRTARAGAARAKAPSASAPATSAPATGKTATGKTATGKTATGKTATGKTATGKTCAVGAPAVGAHEGGGSPLVRHAGRRDSPARGGSRAGRAASVAARPRAC